MPRETSAASAARRISPTPGRSSTAARCLRSPPAAHQRERVDREPALLHGVVEDRAEPLPDLPLHVRRIPLDLGMMGEQSAGVFAVTGSALRRSRWFSREFSTSRT